MSKVRRGLGRGVWSGLIFALALPVSAQPVSSRPSYLSRLWQLDEATRASSPIIAPHRSNYALVFSFNSSPNAGPLVEANPAATVPKTEFPFQLSLKVRIWPNMFGGRVDLWFGYTQRSFWQAYDLNKSAPFRETDYEPEALVTVRTRFTVLGLTTRFVQFGVNHQSNGRPEPLSRTWDRLILNAGLEGGKLTLLVKGWYHLPEPQADVKNPRIGHFMGPGEIWGYYFLKKHRLGVMLRDNLNFRENRGAIQLEWSFPFVGPVAGYVQYFRGYGESLLDHDHRVNRIGVGFILGDWD